MSTTSRYLSIVMECIIVYDSIHFVSKLLLDLLLHTMTKTSISWSLCWSEIVNTARGPHGTHNYIEISSLILHTVYISQRVPSWFQQCWNRSLSRLRPIIPVLPRKLHKAWLQDSLLNRPLCFGIYWCRVMDKMVCLELAFQTCWEILHCKTVPVWHKETNQLVLRDLDLWACNIALL